MSDIKRRVFLKATLASGAIGVAVGAGLLTPRTVLAAWPKAAFGAKSVKEALMKLHDAEAAADSGDIQLKAPDIAENGAVVPVTVDTTLSHVESIDIVIEKNNRPLGANFVLTPSAKGTVSTRVKVAESGKVTAWVKSGGKLYSASKDIKVTIGGCGG